MMPKILAIEQDIALWTTQLTKGGQLDTLTQDIEATLAERKEAYARVQQKLTLLEATLRITITNTNLTRLPTQTRRTTNLAKNTLDVDLIKHRLTHDLLEDHHDFSSESLLI